MSIETGLMQFMKQYEDAIEKKVEDEKVNKAKDIKSPLKWDPMILFEDIFSKVYINSKFGEVKTEVYGCISTNIETLPNSLGFIKRFRATSKVTEAFWKKDRRSFEVSIDTITGEYKCGCKMFEFRGILCCHIMKCLDVLDVKVIPDKYILDRWRKDLVRGYENIRVGYYNPNESERVKRSLEITVKK
ncbi:protein FAR1-RELATED SEQUENCE 6-like [Silene latifolia]|uniref:protein FAR1-RELATED SEQUENCE 6-like n=1 Tax=Silene latifolia TaxID=37657 RepID=UPI003D7744AD